MNAAETISEFNDNVRSFQGVEVLGKGAITGVLERACGGSANRYLVLKVLTGKTSSKELSEAEWFALQRIVQPEKPAGGHWQSARGEYELKQICGNLLSFVANVPEQYRMTF